jgi:hypothetical protein
MNFHPLIRTVCNQMNLKNQDQHKSNPDNLYKLTHCASCVIIISCLISFAIDSLRSDGPARFMSNGTVSPLTIFIEKATKQVKNDQEVV